MNREEALFKLDKMSLEHGWDDTTIELKNHIEELHVHRTRARDIGEEIEKMCFAGVRQHWKNISRFKQLALELQGKGGE